MPKIDLYLKYEIYKVMNINNVKPVESYDACLIFSRKTPSDFSRKIKKT